MCILRAWGEFFDVDKFASETSLEPYEVFRKGEFQFPHSTRPREHDHSGLKCTVSRAEWEDLPAQIEDATAFLDLHREELRRLVNFPGTYCVALDFPFTCRVGTGIFVQGETLPPAFLAAAGNLGIYVWLSLYPGPGHLMCSVCKAELKDEEAEDDEDREDDEDEGSDPTV